MKTSTSFVTVPCLLLVCASLISCAGSPARIALMNVDEIKSVTDGQLCYAYNRPDHTPLMASEVQRRSLDCGTYKAATTSATSQTSTRGNSWKESTTSTSSTTQNVLVSCSDTKFVNLTEDQGKALHYAVEQRMSLKGSACITELQAIEKFPFRGLTMVKYVVIVHYPNGYKTECLGRRPGSLDFDLQVRCGGIGNIMEGAPVPPGESKKYCGEDVI